MRIFLIVIAAVFGGTVFGIAGIVLGVAFGYVLGELLDVKRRLQNLSTDLEELRLRLQKDPKTRDIFRTGFERLQVDENSRLQQSSHFDSHLTDWVEASPEVNTGALPKTVPGPEHAMPVPPFAPASESELQRRLRTSRIRELLTKYVYGGNILVKVGVLILFLGVAFLLRYAAERDLLPIEVRLAGVALVGIVLLVTGWCLRQVREGYALVLQGGGIGVLYLTVFAALRLYSLIPAPLAMLILMAVAGLSAAIAVLQDSPSLAVLGVIGGFMAPVLTSTGHGSHIQLFSFYALLNASIFGIAWFKAWRILNLVGFVCTFGLGSAWGFSYYQPRYFATAEPFLMLFFLFYVSVAVLFALRQPAQLKGYVDGTLVFGTPLVVFSLQTMLVRNYEFGIAWSALVLGGFYLGLAWLLFRKRILGMRTLTEAFLAIGVAFGTLAVPLAVDNRWTAAAWALEGAAMVWVGGRQQRLPARVSGVLLQLGAGLALLIDPHVSTRSVPVLNGIYLGCVSVSLTGLFSALSLYRSKPRVKPWEQVISTVLGTWGLLWWFGAGLHELDRYASHHYLSANILIFLALSCLLCDFLEKRLAWPFLRYPALGLLPALYAAAGANDVTGSHPFAQMGYVGWSAAFAAYYRILFRNEHWREDVLKFLHAGALWLLTGLAVRELAWQSNRWVPGAGTWAFIAWGLMPSLIVLVLSRAGDRLTWPVRKYFRAYLTIGLGPIALYVWLWTVAANCLSRGDPWPLSYLPIVNPLDVTVGFCFIALFAWLLRLRSESCDLLSALPVQLLPAVTAASLFLWMNAVLVRTIHYWGGVGYSLQAMFDSMLFQVSVSLLWSLSGLLIMVFATHKVLRNLWLLGAGVLAVVVVKLFLIDLSGTGTVERIVSFIGVGALLLIVGYYSPVPPRKTEEKTAR